MRQTLIDLFASKKFLAALTAIIVYIAGRFGFDVDTVALDRIYAALLVYIGAQAVADHGKSAALVQATAQATAQALESAPIGNDPPRVPIVGRDGSVVGWRSSGGATIALMVLGVTLAGATLPACSWTKSELKAGGSALISCTAADHAKIEELIADLATKRKPDGSRDWPAIESEAIAAGVTIGGCALVALGAAPDPGQAALERARAHWGDVRWSTTGGVR